MPCYLVTYELKQPRHRYVEFMRELKSFEEWAQILDATWAVVSPLSAVEVRDHLWQFMDPDDGIFVIESGREAAWQDVRCENQWLRDHL
ncbi:MAG: hypothetical protein D6701_12550 [Gemmatimonadetes bacterium]|nr:MAG: hypothetical protein D6701_12550 [Gemmatimonadota bacterium]